MVALEKAYRFTFSDSPVAHCFEYGRCMFRSSNSGRLKIAKEIFKPFSPVIVEGLQELFINN
jgi:hypothetical protein